MAFFLVCDRYGMFCGSMFLVIAVSDVIPLFEVDCRVTILSKPLREPYSALAMHAMNS